MKTEITYSYKGVKHKAILDVLNPCNAGATLLILRPEIEPMKLKIISCVGHAKKILSSEMSLILTSERLRKPCQAA